MLVVTIRAVVVLAAAVATWVLVQSRTERLDDRLTLVVAGAAVLAVALSALDRRLQRRRRRWPAIIEELSGAAGKVAREHDDGSVGVVLGLLGMAAGGCAAAFTAAGGLEWVGAGVGVVCGLGAYWVHAASRRGRRKADALRDEIVRVRGGGTPTRGVVTGTSGEGRWRYGAPVITVWATIETPAGTRAVVGTILPEPAQVPAVGGTVLVWYLGDGSGEVHVDVDPESIREPGAAEKYESSSPS
ncbi:hypothetical protein [Jiangella alba]|uniref:Uncharacterized protein n=1 Tax=Jiangella alba TaxID=561176 RepID=A0A1H5L1E4_9ACTN|nr:hypothetical protein [Jiangella alba]SEE70803.1 hypothetical protein SAMN04488561_2357 [Jiangella alba]